MLNPHAELEDIEKFKAWWKEYGFSVIIGVLLGVALLFGFRYWDAYQKEQREKASVLYEQLLQHVLQNKKEAANQTGMELLKDYDSTPYAGMAALLLARVSYETGDTPKARAHLQWAVAHARDPSVAHTARLRLARLMLEAQEYEQAMLLLQQARDQTGFESAYQELLGDIYAVQGRRDQARAAYRAALQHLSERSGYAQVLRMKLDDLGTEGG